MEAKKENLGKVLVVCKELYTYPMTILTSELLKQGYCVEAIFAHPTETTLKNHSYLNYKEQNNITIHTFDDELECFWNNHKRASEFLDHNYLKNIELRYMQEVTLGVVLMSTQLFTTAYHGRFYFKDLNYSEQLYWLQLVFKKIEKILFEGKYTRIVDIDISELARTCLALVSDLVGVPYVTLESSRYKSIFLPTTTMGRKVDNYFLRSYQSPIPASSRSIEEVLSFRGSQNIMVPDYAFNSTSNKKTSFIYKLRSLLSRLRVLTERWKSNRSKLTIFKKKPMVASLMDSYWFFIKVFYRDVFLASKCNKYFIKPDLSKDYLYFPLHLIPESTTLVKAPFYPNELSVIEAISKSLPLGMMLFVKEHPAMIGEREFSFYKKIIQLPNVVLIDPISAPDIKEMILQSHGVATLTGTSAFEAAMLGKPAVMFGTSFFEVIEGIYKVGNFDELPGIINMIINTSLDNVQSCAKYLDSLYDYGETFPITEVLVKSRSYYFSGLDNDLLLKKHINSLADLLFKDIHVGRNID